MPNSIGCLIMTCDKNADLAPFVNASYDSLFPGLDEAFIVTEFEGKVYGERHVIRAESLDFATKMRQGLRSLRSEYVLLLLDDHFLLDAEASSKVRRAVDDLIANNAACISLAKSDKAFVKYKPGVTPTAKVFAALQKYQIDFHPTLWRKDVLLDLLGDACLSAWEIEPLFCRYLLDNQLIALYLTNHLRFVELVYRGAFIRGPFLRHGISLYRGNRAVQSRGKYLKFKVRMWLYHHTPYWIKRRASRE